MDGCKSGEISKPGWELSSSGQHHGWRVELECLPTPHAAPQFSHHNAVSPLQRASEQAGGDDRRGQVIHPGSSRIGDVGGWRESVPPDGARRTLGSERAARERAVIIFLDFVVYASPHCARIRGRAR